jgi:VWFA-related protein
VRRLIVLISDGEDNGSQHEFKEAISEALNSDVRIYAISTNTSATKAHGDDVLRQLATETGGRVFFPHDANDLDSIFREIALELLHEYSLAYTPTNQAHDGAFRTVRVEAFQKGLHVRARSGYFSPLN